MKVLHVVPAVLAAGLLLSQLPRTDFAGGGPDLASVLLVALLIVPSAALPPLPVRLPEGRRAYAAEREDAHAPN